MRHEVAGNETSALPFSALSRKTKMAAGVIGASLAMLAYPNGPVQAEQKCSPTPVKEAKQYDQCTERRLQGNIRPAMLDAAKVIIATAKERPRLSLQRVGKDTITVSLLGFKGLKHQGKNKEFDEVDVDVTTRRLSKSRVPNPNGVISVELSRLGWNKKHPDQNYDEFLDLYAPDAPHRFKSNNRIVDLGWEAQELVRFGQDRNNVQDYDTANPAVEPGYGGPVSTAKIITGDMPPLLGRIESDLRGMTGVFGPN